MIDMVGDWAFLRILIVIRLLQQGGSIVEGEVRIH